MLLGVTFIRDGWCQTTEQVPVDPDPYVNSTNGYPVGGEPTISAACPCMAIYNGMCSSQGVTFMNHCVLTLCANQTLGKEGECGQANYQAPTAQIPCGCGYSFEPACGSNGVTFQSSCVAFCSGNKVESIGECISDCGCTKNYNPVCGMDNLTYDNYCLMKCDDIKIQNKGQCFDKNVKCGHCKGFTDIVCGADGKVYDNSCYMSCAGTSLYRKGSCPQTSPCNCLSVYQPVCGADWKTYKNQCELTCSGVSMLYKSACRDPHQPRQDCNVCPNYTEPVCASDGLTYKNLCHVQCRNKIKAVHYGECAPIQVPG